MIYIGIDLSLNSTGVCILINGERHNYLIEPEKIGKFETFEKYEKYNCITDTLEKIFNKEVPIDIKKEDVLINLEDSTGIGANGSLDESERHGVIRSYLIKKFSYFYLTSPLNLKNFIFTKKGYKEINDYCKKNNIVKGKKTIFVKRKVVEACNAKYKTQFKYNQHDICEAFILAKMIQNYKENWIEYKIEEVHSQIKRLNTRDKKKKTFEKYYGVK